MWSMRHVILDWGHFCFDVILWKMRDTWLERRQRAADNKKRIERGGDGESDRGGEREDPTGNGPLACGRCGNGTDYGDESQKRDPTLWLPVTPLLAPCTTNPLACPRSTTSVVRRFRHGWSYTIDEARGGWGTWFVLAAAGCWRFLKIRLRVLFSRNCYSTDVRENFIDLL